MRPNADGKSPFTSSLDCALKVMKARGLVGLYKGFPLFLCRSLPVTTVLPLSLHTSSSTHSCPHFNSKSCWMYLFIWEVIFYFLIRTLPIGLGMAADHMDDVRRYPGLRGICWIVAAQEYPRRSCSLDPTHNCSICKQGFNLSRKLCCQ
jgi:hypothetical protein